MVTQGNEEMAEALEGWDDLNDEEPALDLEDLDYDQYLLELS